MRSCFGGHVADHIQGHIYDLHRKSQENLASAQRKMLGHLASGADVRESQRQSAEEHRNTLEKKIENLEDTIIILQEMLGLKNPEKEGYKVLFSTRGTDGAALWKNLADDTLYWEAYSRYTSFEEIGFHTYDTPSYLYPVSDTGCEDKEKKIIKRLLEKYEKYEKDIVDNNGKQIITVWELPSEYNYEDERGFIALCQDGKRWLADRYVNLSLVPWLKKIEQSIKDNWYRPIDKHAQYCHLGRYRNDKGLEKIRLAMLNDKLGKPVMGNNPFKVISLSQQHIIK